MVEHHLVVLAPDAGLLVAAERGVRRVLVVAVRPDPAGLDLATGPVGLRTVARPDAGAEPVEGVVGDLERVVLVVEAGHRDDRAEDLLLEDPHRVVALEDRRLDVVAAGQVAAELGPRAAGEHLGALLAADVEVGQDLLELVVRGLRADHGVGVERVALLDRLRCARPRRRGTGRRSSAGSARATGRCRPRPG